RQSCQVFEDVNVVQKFIGPRLDPVTTLDPRHPITLGPYMNDPDLINNKYQLHMAQEAALGVFADLAKEYAELSGRYYPALETYLNEDAEVALFILNSAAETSKDAIDRARAEGKKASVLKPNLLRPFPFMDLQKASRHLSSMVIAERSDDPGSVGGPLSHEVRSILLADKHCEIATASRVYGIGGKDFREQDALDLVELGMRLKEPSQSELSFDFIGVKTGRAQTVPPLVLPALDREQMEADLVRLEVIQNIESKTRVRALSKDPSQLVMRPKRLAPGHGACPGCGIFSGLDQFFKGIKGDVVVLYHTGCAMVVTTDYPFSSHRVTYLHNLFQNGAPTLSGLVEVFYEKQRRGEIQVGADITFIMITGDGGMDIGMGPTIGTALRNHNMIILEYDNQGYMNTGGQLSYTTPYGRSTSTSQVGPKAQGKGFHHKDTLSIMAATGIPYVFSAIEGFGTDLVEKAAKAQWYAKHKGLAFGKILVACPLNWNSEERNGLEVLQRAVDSCFFPLFEVEEGLTTLNYNPESSGRKIPLRNWLQLVGKERHLLKPENEDHLKEFQMEVDRRWARLKARAEHPLL
ncbi:MAG: thiamine pyrophosphate-dependent enzyme, partial [Bdellovibrio sp.]